MFGKKRTFDTNIATGSRPKGISKRDWENRRVEFVDNDGNMIWAGPAAKMPRKIEYRARKGWRLK